MKYFCQYLLKKHKDFNVNIPEEIMEEFIHICPNGAFLILKVKPNASLESLSLGTMDEIVLSVKALTKDNEANDRVIKILSKIFSLKKSQIEIVSGHRSKIKKIFFKV